MKSKKPIETKKAAKPMMMTILLYSIKKQRYLLARTVTGDYRLPTGMTKENEPWSRATLRILNQQANLQVERGTRFSFVEPGNGLLCTTQLLNTYAYNPLEPQPIAWANMRGLRQHTRTTVELEAVRQAQEWEKERQQGKPLPYFNPWMNIH